MAEEKDLAGGMKGSNMYYLEIKWGEVPTEWVGIMVEYARKVLCFVYADVRSVMTSQRVRCRCFLAVPLHRVLRLLSCSTKSIRNFGLAGEHTYKCAWGLDVACSVIIQARNENIINKILTPVLSFTVGKRTCQGPWHRPQMDLRVSAIGSVAVRAHTRKSLLVMT